MLSGKFIIRALQGLNTLLVLVLVFFVAALTEKFYISWDWTSNRNNSLAPRSEQILQGLAGPLEVIVAYSKRAESAGSKPKLEKILALYLKVRPDLQIEYLNSTENPKRAEEMSIRHDIEVHLNYEGRTRIITEINESNISNALLRLMQERDLRVRWLEQNPRSSALTRREPDGLSAWTASLKEEGIDLETINLIQTPDLNAQDLDLLIAASPSTPLLDKEVELIDHYILAGGNALLMIDPNQGNGLEKVVREYGIDTQPGVIIDARSEIFLGSALTVMTTIFPDHPVMKRLERPLIFPIAGSFDYSTLSDADGWARKFLVRSESHTWLEKSLGNSGVVEYNPDEGEETGEKPIALVMTRALDEKALQQAFGEGVELMRQAPPATGPQTDEGGMDGGADERFTADGDDEVDENPADDLLGAQSDEQRLIVIADSGFARNEHIGRAGNLTFANDAVNWLSGNDELLEITRGKVGDQELNVEPDQLGALFVFWGIVVPVLFLLTGAIITIRRRRLR